MLLKSLFKEKSPKHFNSNVYIRSNFIETYY